MPYYTATCPHCNIEFRAFRSAKQGPPTYCSFYCRDEARRIYQTCLGCGKTFVTKKSAAATKNQQFCTRECRKAHTATKHTRTCQQCGQPFVAAYASAGKFCSQACVFAHRDSLPPEVRQARIANAQAAIRGAKRSHEDLCKRARTKQDRAQLSGDELVIIEAMHSAGLHPVPLLAVDKFNVDFGFPDAMIAVEYHGGNWHNSAVKQAQDARKREYLEAHGWRMLVFPRIRKDNRYGSRSIQVETLVKAVHDAMPPPR